jgi:hypothetical protein
MHVSTNSMWRGTYCFFVKYFRTKQGHMLPAKSLTLFTPDSPMKSRGLGQAQRARSEPGLFWSKLVRGAASSTPLCLHGPSIPIPAHPKLCDRLHAFSSGPSSFNWSDLQSRRASKYSKNQRIEKALLEGTASRKDLACLHNRSIRSFIPSGFVSLFSAYALLLSCKSQVIPESLFLWLLVDLHQGYEQNMIYSRNYLQETSWC